MTEVLVRELTLEDDDQIIDLITECVLNGDDLQAGGLLPTKKNASTFYTMEILPILIDREPIFGAFIEKKLVGISCCSLKINNIYNLKEKIAIGGVTAVTPQERRKGIGTKLRSKLAKDLKSRKVSKFIFEIESSNEASLLNVKKMASNINADAQLFSFKFAGDLNVFQ